MDAAATATLPTVLVVGGGGLAALLAGLAIVAAVRWGRAWWRARDGPGGRHRGERDTPQTR
jgi:hypothetical protein